MPPRHIWPVLLLGVLSACAGLPPGGEAPPRAEAASSASQDLLQRQVVTAQEQSARLEVKVSQFSTQLKTLASVVREIQNRQSALEDRIEHLRRELLSRRVPPAPKAAPKPKPRRAAKKPPPPPPKPARRARAPRMPTKTLASLTPQEAYNRAYRAIREKKNTEAILHFQDFLKRFPRNRLAANAQYWLGESYYDLKKFPTALEEFEKVVMVYPQSRKVPDALYKRGLTYLRLKDSRKAALEFEKLLERFPNHPLTEKARGQLRTLGQAGNNLRR